MKVFEEKLSNLGLSFKIEELATDLGKRGKQCDKID